jgi:O-antigen/teichoic acid export membrane protein
LILKVRNYISQYFMWGVSPIVRRVYRNFSISFAGSLGLMFLSLLRTAVLTKSLVINDYGRFLIVINLVSFLINFLSFRVEDLFYRLLPTFKEEEDIGGLRGLFFIGIILSISIGLLVNIGTFIFAPWISENIYHDPELALAIRIYSFTALLWASQGFSTSILRLKDRFASVVFPRVIGAFIAVVGFYIYFNFTETYSLVVVVLIFCLEVLIQTIFPLYQAFRSISQYIFTRNYPVARSLYKHRNNILRTIFNTNLYGYLYKITGSPGDLFLLGVFATPAQVAIYNIAQQIVRAVIVLQNNIQTAITPEIVSLWAKGKVTQLYRLIIRFSSVSFSIGIIAIIVGYLLARPIVLLISSIEYIDAVFVLYVLILKVYLTFSTLPFYSMTLSMDQLSKRNFALFFQLLVTVLAIVSTLTAFKMALVQLFGVMLVVLTCDLFVYMKLHQISQKNLQHHLD